VPSSTSALTVLKDYWLEAVFVLLALTWGLAWATTVPPVEIKNLSDRLQSNELLVSTLGLSITAISILFPLTLGIHYVLHRDFGQYDSNRFLRASLFLLLSLGAALYVVSDVPAASHRVDRIASATRTGALLGGAIHAWFFIAGLAQMLIGARSATKAMKQETVAVPTTRDTTCRRSHQEAQREPP